MDKPFSKVVPQSDIDRIEVAREALWKLAQQFNIPANLITDITAPMWRIAHRKYPKIREVR